MKRLTKIFLTLSFIANGLVISSISQGADNEVSESIDEFFERFWFKGTHNIQNVDQTPLFITDIEGATNADELEKHAITHVVSITNSEIDKLPSINYLAIKIDDQVGVPIRPHFNKVFEFVEDSLAQNDARILFHCDAGMSRSASFLIAYMMYEYKISFDEAHAAVKKVRKIIDPNPSFIEELKNFEAELQKDL